ncbi:M13 family metallopeptidase [Novosphingobium flavum]|uniref:M13 family metallopeptidase n=1 Tax=Novosphingobium flavum TaxID=1778672 RepID=A0A7X1FQ08_9SPHN|nr:M13 family metallopeptidase [Novosphingobium flavum]MBC2664412.1 M13 family metallopeptidase [Novosphingobium flavum]
MKRTILLAATLLAATAAPLAAPLWAADEDWGRSGIQIRWVDPAVRPGDDFFRYVNGKWLASHEIPADRTSYGSFQILREESENRLKAIVDELVAKKPAPGTQEARIVAAYSAFMDTAAIERAGLVPARPYLARIAAAKTVSDLYGLFAAPGFASPINGAVDPDPKQSDHYSLNLSLGGLGLPDRDYYLSDNPRYPEIREKYKAYLAMLLGEAGYADPKATAEAVYKLEEGMARIEWDREILRNDDLLYHKLTVAELAALPHGADLVAFVRALGPGAAAAQSLRVTEIPLTAEQRAAARISAEDAKAKMGGGFPAMLDYVASQPVETWKAWSAAQFLIGHAAYLPARIDEANFAFYGKLLGGQPEQRPRWKRALGVVEGQIGEQLGRIYAERWFPADSRTQMAALVANLRKAMSANLATLSWMGPKTRAEAEAKLAAFTPKIGAPDSYKTYDGLAISATDPLANAVASGDWQAAFADRRIGKAVDRAEWFMFPQTVNAYYNPPMNEIVFPAAILQPPFFNPAADPAANYGAIGAVIGHEMGHGFDDQGSKYDGTGNLRDWWSAEDKARFVALTDRLAAQYDKFCPFDSGQTCVNGKLTLGENIGDLGGLSLAYRAYHLSLGGKAAPVIDGLTGDQRFFMAFAQVWRSKYREETARQLLLVDPHSPAQFRANGIVRNFDEWYKAFGIKPGDKLYLPPDQRLRIW